MFQLFQFFKNMSGSMRKMALKVKCHIDCKEKKKTQQPKQFYQKAFSSGLITGSSDRIPEIRGLR